VQGEIPKGQYLNITSLKPAHPQNLRNGMKQETQQSPQPTATLGR